MVNYIVLCIILYFVILFISRIRRYEFISLQYIVLLSVIKFSSFILLSSYCIEFEVSSPSDISQVKNFFKYTLYSFTCAIQTYGSYAYFDFR